MGCGHGPSLQEAGLSSTPDVEIRVEEGSLAAKEE